MDLAREHTEALGMRELEDAVTVAIGDWQTEGVSS